MANPYLPSWEYIPDGEPRVFGDRVYIYGSHDRPCSEDFCDKRLKCWSASVDDLEHWTCHGDIFHTMDDNDHKTDTPWTTGSLFAPDVVEKDGKYYLYAYIEGAKGCVAVSDRPEGPFKTISTYKIPEGEHNRDYDEGIFIDPGVLVDDDGRVYIYCGYLHSFMAEINPDNMYEILPGTYQADIIPQGEEPTDFFEACSPRKVGDTYYLIYSPKACTRLAYATSDKPTGPFTFRGYLVDTGVDYPGGNDHGSICKIKDQWYIFCHKMTNGTIMSRFGCVEKLEMNEDGTFNQAEFTSQGFEKALRPFEETKAEFACVLKGGCFICEKNIFSRPVVNICGGSVIGYKYFDFGEDFSATGITLCVNILGCGQTGLFNVRLDSEDGEIIGTGKIPLDDGVMKVKLPNITGKHAVFFTVETGRVNWFKDAFDGRELCKFDRFVFVK